MLAKYASDPSVSEAIREEPFWDLASAAMALEALCFAVETHGPPALTCGYTYECMPNAATIDVRNFSRLFKALGDDTRLRIVALLSHGELCVCHLEGALGLSQPNVSRHLAILRSAGVVEDRRQGTWVHYRLLKQEDDDRERLLRALVRSFGNRDVLRRDVARLVSVCGPGACR
jgi:ArsR family transcriptional regulator